MNNRITYVTAFYNINRDKWQHFNRTVNQYIENFKPYIDIFKQNIKDSDYNMIVYIDEKHYTEIKQLLDPALPIQLIKINDKFMKEQISVWSRLNREREIMNSITYKSMVGPRIIYPESHIPEYTLINHAKIDFVNHAMKYTDASYLCWTDFGYFQLSKNIPTKHIDLSKIDTERINYTLITKIQDCDKSIEYTLKVAPERFGGFFFCGNRTKLKEYQQLYHIWLDKFDELNIADDDQHVALRCYLHTPNLFCLHYTGEWHAALTYFAKQT